MWLQAAVSPHHLLGCALMSSTEIEADRLRRHPHARLVPAPCVHPWAKRQAFNQIRSLV